MRHLLHLPYNLVIRLSPHYKSITLPKIWSAILVHSNNFIVKLNYNSNGLKFKHHKQIKIIEVITKAHDSKLHCRKSPNKSKENY